MNVNVLIELLMLILILFAVQHIRNSLMSGCCGGEDIVKRIPPEDGNSSHYPYKTTLIVEGMHCSNCALRVENALNSVPGIYAKVNIESGKATVLMKTEQPLESLCDTVRRIGYSAHPAG